MSAAPEIFMPSEIVFRSVEELLPYAANSRNHSPAQIDALCAVIRKAGWTNPLLIADGGILAGHDFKLVRLHLATPSTAISNPAKCRAVCCEARGAGASDGQGKESGARRPRGPEKQRLELP